MAKFVPYQESYDHLLKCDEWAKWLAWISTGLAAILFGLEFVEGVPKEVTKWITIFNCIAILAFAAFDIYIRVTFQRVRSKKRLDLLDNSYGTTFLDENSEDYYSNNELKPSLYKLAANCFESNFFTVSIAKEMKDGLMLKLACVAVVLVLAAAMGDKWLAGFIQLSLPVLIASDFIRHNNLLEETSKNLLEFQSLFTDIKGRVDSSSVGKDLHMEAKFIKLIMNYEAAITAAGVLLDQDIYKKRNPALTKAWTAIKVRYQIV